MPKPFTIGYLKADGLSLIVTEVFIILTSSQSLKSTAWEFYNILEPNKV